MIIPFEAPNSDSELCETDKPNYDHGTLTATGQHMKRSCLLAVLLTMIIVIGGSQK